MTVYQLRDLLAALPATWDRTPVYYSGPAGAPLVRVVVLIPSDPGDSTTPRIELRSQLPYSSAFRPCECKTDTLDCAGDAISDAGG